MAAEALEAMLCQTLAQGLGHLPIHLPCRPQLSGICLLQAPLVTVAGSRPASHRGWTPRPGLGVYDSPKEEVLKDDPISLVHREGSRQGG